VRKDLEILIELFTSPTCPHCPRAKRMAEGVVRQLPGALLIERDVSEPENQRAAAEYGIRGVPTMVINRKHVITGAPGSEHELMDAIRRMG
jgi:small redox-active disulfide protein 1